MAEKHDTHERLNRDHEPKTGSDRNFGLVFSAFCAIVAGIDLWFHHGRLWAWAGAAVAFATLALAAPRVLHPLNVVWFKLGMLLHHIVSPVVLGLMFYLVVTPTGLWMRLRGKRPLNLGFDSRADSYWILRKPPGPPPGSFDNQF